MKKMVIEIEELYPVYMLTNELGYGQPCEIPEELIQDYERNMKEFESIQDKLRQIYYSGKSETEV